MRKPTRAELVEALITLETQAKIIDAIREDRRGIYLALRTGIPPGEARALNVEDWVRDFPGQPFRVCSLSARRCRVRTRTLDEARGRNKKERAPIAVDQELGESLVEYRAEAPSGRSPLRES